VENTGWEGGEWKVFMFGAPKVVAPLVLIKDRIDYVLVHSGFMGSCKLSSFDGHRVGRYLTTPPGCTSG
jgi:hypothetical protein